MTRSHHQLAASLYSLTFALGVGLIAASLTAAVAFDVATARRLPFQSARPEAVARRAMSEGEFGVAARVYRTLAAIEPGSEAGLLLGRALEKMGERGAAAEAYRAYLRGRPGHHVEARLRLGVLLYQAGDFRGAVTQNRTVVRLDPRNAQAHRNLAAAQAALGKRDKAIASYQRALQLAPGDAAARRGLSELVGPSDEL